MLEELSHEEERSLEKWLAAVEPMNTENTTKALKEVKKIMEDLGITFFLMSGTCLGVIRDNRLIPWDDDVDIGSVLDYHGCNEESLEEIVIAFRRKGFLTKLIPSGQHFFLPLIKYSAKVALTVFRIIDGNIEEYPSIFIPASMFTELKEINFLGENFYIPNPPEEYLRLKYGDQWRTPKKHGVYEKDIIYKEIDNWTTSQEEKLGKSFGNVITDDQVCRIKVIDKNGEPINEADIIVIGLGSCKTNGDGYAKFYIPKANCYPIVIRYRDFEEIDFFPWIYPGEEYIYTLK